MGELWEPVDAERRALLRLAVVEHLRTYPGRRFPPVVHVGTPGGVVRRFTALASEPTDHALRCDAVAALLGRPGAGPAPWLWLTRAGQLDLHDLDVAWLRAALAAYAEADTDLTMVVVTRRGWSDPRTGLRRTWVRLRR